MRELDLTEILLEKVEEDYQNRRNEVVERSGEFEDLLIRIAKVGRWDLATNVLGTETHHHEQEKDLDLLERCGLIESEIKYTKHNEYRKYSVTGKGQAMIRRDEE